MKNETHVIIKYVFFNEEACLAGQVLFGSIFSDEIIIAYGDFLNPLPLDLDSTASSLIKRVLSFN